MKVNIIGAFDRMNYGDLLFPLLLTEYLGEHYGETIKIDYFSHRKADLVEYGGFKTKPISLLFKSRTNPKEKTIFIIAGGEVLAANWVSVLYNVIGKRTWWQKLSRRLPVKDAEIRAIRYYLRCKNTHPYLIRKKDVGPSSTIIYNAVGGANLDKKDSSFKQSVATVLKDSDYISVRDKRTYDILSDTGIEIPSLIITPDSAAVISQLFPKNDLDNKISSEVKTVKQKLQEKPFLTFQIGLSFTKNNELIIANQLDIISDKTGLKIILLPIGRAAGHEDQKPLKKIHNLLKSSSVITDKNTLFDTMWYIANSALFIGSSLHGAITAISYGIPHIALKGDDLKIPAFLDHWDIAEQQKCVGFNEISDNAISRLTIPKESLVTLMDDFVSSSLQSLEVITSIIDQKIV